MGVVYEATQLSLNRTVALKLLAPHLGEDPAFRKRFQREGSVQARLDHPHIITVYEAGESEEGLFLAMRLVRGPNLKDMIVSRQLDAGRTLRLLKPIAEAVDVAHDAQLIHRDIKPQNILIGGREHAWLADFGLTKTSGETAVTKSGQFVGTLDYISPEQISDYEATQRSDIYSLGGVLYESLVGSVPFPKKSEAAVIYAHLQVPPPRVSDERPELPRGLDDVIAKAMAKEPADRYARASDLMTAAAEAFDRRSRAVLSAPAAIVAPEQVGVRAPETRVPTEERPREPEPELAPTAELAPPERRVRPALVAASIAGLAGLAALGFLVATPGKSKAEPDTSAAPAGSLSVAIPSEWRPLAERVSAPGVSVRDPLAVGPPGTALAGLVVGQSPVSGAKLVSASFLKAAGNPKPTV